MIWRRLYVPQVGQAAWASLGLRHCGQVVSGAAVAFHCERRDRVLLRDILRFGTATSVLLLVSGARAVVVVANIQLAQLGPARVSHVTVTVPGARLSEADAAV